MTTSTSPRITTPDELRDLLTSIGREPVTMTTNGTWVTITFRDLTDDVYVVDEALYPISKTNFRRWTMMIREADIPRCRLPLQMM